MKSFLDELYGNWFTIFDSALNKPSDLCSIPPEQTKDGITYEVEVPGLKKEDLEITLEDGIITIKQKETSTRRRRPHFFGYAIELPAKCLADKITSKLEDGILTIFCPTSQPAQKQVIPIT